MSIYQAMPRDELSFTVFPYLPPEIRLMIWECTWPAPRVIEAASHETYEDADETDDEDSEETDEDAGYDEFTILRPGGSYSSFFTYNAFNGWRILDSPPLEQCPHPVALQVCHESRHHTLKEYTAMQHTKSTLGSFYFSPNRDFLWFCIDFTDEPKRVDDLKAFYGNQLQNFKRVLVMDIVWTEDMPSAYTRVFLAALGDLEEIRLVYYNSEDNDNNNNTDDNNNDNDNDNENDSNSTDTEDLHAIAAELKAEYAEFVEAVETSQGVAKRIRYMDFKGKFY